MTESKRHSAQELAEEMTYVFAELLGGAIGLRSQGMTGAAELIEEAVAHLTDQRDGLVEQLEAAQRVVDAALVAYDGFGEDDHRFYGSQKRLADALNAWRERSNPAKEPRA